MHTEDAKEYTNTKHAVHRFNYYRINIRNPMIKQASCSCCLHGKKRNTSSLVAPVNASGEERMMMTSCLHAWAISKASQAADLLLQLHHVLCFAC